MADHLTEEEQIESIKRWWNENWLSIVAPIVVVLLSYTAWNMWKDHTEKTAQAASDQYELLLSVIEPQTLDATAKERAIGLANGIVSDYSNTLYANMASMIVAKFAVDDKDYASAAEQLKTVASDGANEAIKSLATARLAKVEHALGNSDSALALLAGKAADAYKALYAEIRGDIYADSGDKAAATTAYQEAMDNLPAEQFARRGLLQLKMNSNKPAQQSAPQEEEAE